MYSRGLLLTVRGAKLFEGHSGGVRLAPVTHGIEDGAEGFTEWCDFIYDTGRGVGIDVPFDNASVP
jgi:hypothetical protein